ncbi:unnamed protein product [Amoebophrya sp. A25]|nr:unnamed protein product [Amoebophrya sp. A25]|eukprot:GSA25T00012275001.1
MGDVPYQGTVFRLMLKDATEEGWRLEEAKWFRDAACLEEISPSLEYMVNSQRGQEYGRRKTLSSLPYKAPCDDAEAFDACGCRTPYAGFNSTTNKCQFGESTSVRDEYYCADERIYEAGTDFGCPANSVSYEAWFASWSTKVECVKIKQAVSPAYRGKELLVQRWDGSDEVFTGAIAGFGATDPLQVGEEESISFHQSCGSVYYLPTSTQLDVLLRLNNEKITATLGLDGSGLRAVVFPTPPAHGTRIELHCSADADSTVLNVQCEEGTWNELQRSSRGCAMPHFVPGGFQGEQVKTEFTPANDTTGLDIIALVGAILGGVLGLFLSTFVWRAFFRSGAANLDAELRASSPGSTDGLTDNMFTGINAGAVKQRKGSKSSRMGWDDFQTVPPRKMKSRDGASMSKNNTTATSLNTVTSTINRVEEEMKSSIGRQFNSGSQDGSISSRSQSPSKASRAGVSKSYRSSRRDGSVGGPGSEGGRSRKNSMDGGRSDAGGRARQQPSGEFHDVESVGSASPSRRMRRRLNQADDTAYELESARSNADSTQGVRSAQNRMGGYSYRTGVAGRVPGMEQGNVQGGGSSSSSAGSKSKPESKSKTQQLLESWNVDERPSSAALNALRKKTDKILSSGKPPGASFMEKSAQVLMRKSPERSSSSKRQASAGGNNVSSSSSSGPLTVLSGPSQHAHPHSQQNLMASDSRAGSATRGAPEVSQRPMAGSGSYRNLTSGGSSTSGRPNLADDSFNPYSMGSSKAGASSEQGRNRSRPGSTTAARVAKGQPVSLAAPGQVSRPASGFDGPNEGVNDYYKMRNGRTASANRRAGGEGGAAQPVDRFGNPAPAQGRKPTRDIFGV